MKRMDEFFILLLIFLPARISFTYTADELHLWSFYLPKALFNVPLKRLIFPTCKILSENGQLEQGKKPGLIFLFFT